jgi:hypothetical protein
MSNTSESAATLPHDNLQALSIALTFLFPAAATVSLALRLYSRSLTRTFALGKNVGYLSTVRATADFR